MLNADDKRRCECCGEASKAAVNDGFICDNFECAIRQDMFSEEEREKRLLEKVRVGNTYNETDPEVLRNARNRVGICIDTVADIIGVLVTDYVEKEQGRKVILKDEYALLMTLFRTKESLAAGKRCGKCRFYREVSAFSTYGRCIIADKEEQVGVSRKACGKWRAREDECY